jgi:hypothetical protein
MDNAALSSAVQGTELLLAFAAFVSIIVTQIVTTKLNSSKIEALTTQVEKQNGKVGRTLKRMRLLEIRCAALHGVAASDLDLDDEEDDG